MIMSNYPMSPEQMAIIRQNRLTKLQKPREENPYKNKKCSSCIMYKRTVDCLNKNYASLACKYYKSNP